MLWFYFVGRAGRYGCQGIAVSLVTEKDEATKFNEIIDTYELRIQQFESNWFNFRFSQILTLVITSRFSFEFKDDLSDIVLTRNEAVKLARIDDVTISKVELSKEELDHSLFEYEQHKHTKKLNTDIQQKSTDILTRKGLTNESKIFAPNFMPMKELEKQFAEFDPAYPASINLNEVQTKFQSILHKNCLNIDVDNIKELRSKLNADFCSKLIDSLEKENSIKSANSGKLETTQIVNLNTFYKWEQIDTAKETRLSSSEILKSTLENNKRTEIVQENDQNELNRKLLLYSHYYSYYYKKFLKNYIWI